MTIFECSKTKFISHRGFQPLAPENSLPSFTYAGLLGQWAIETDVRKTKDGILVCCHNGEIDTYCDGVGAIAEMTLEELRRVSIVKGNRVDCFTAEERRIPTFSEYLAICKRYGSVPFVELKTDDAEAVIHQLRAEGFSDEEVVMSATHAERLYETRRVSERMFVHWIFAKEEGLDAFATLGNAGISFRIADPFACTFDQIESAKRRGLRVCLRAADSVATVARMKELGLDYFPTNCMHDPLNQ